MFIMTIQPKAPQIASFTHPWQGKRDEGFGGGQEVKGEQRIQSLAKRQLRIDQARF